MYRSLIFFLILIIPSFAFGQTQATNGQYLVRQGLVDRYYSLSNVTVRVQTNGTDNTKYMWEIWNVGDYLLTFTNHATLKLPVESLSISLNQALVLRAITNDIWATVGFGSVTGGTVEASGALLTNGSNQMEADLNAGGYDLTNVVHVRFTTNSVNGGHWLRPQSDVGEDNEVFFISGGGSALASRGANIIISGRQNANYHGQLRLSCGTGSVIRFGSGIVQNEYTLILTNDMAQFYIPLYVGTTNVLDFINLATNVVSFPFIATNAVYEVTWAGPWPYDLRLTNVWSQCDSGTGTVWIVESVSNAPWRAYGQTNVQSSVSTGGVWGVLDFPIIEAGNRMGLLYVGGTCTQGYSTVWYTSPR